MLRNLIFSSLIAFTSFSALTPAYAEPQQNPSGQHRQWDPAKAEEFRAKRQERLHQALKLTADQEQAWKTYVEKTKMGPRPDRGKREEMAKLSAPERMEKRLQHMREMMPKMEAHLAALKDFYGQLTPEQKAIMDNQFSHHGPRGHGDHNRGHHKDKGAKGSEG